MSKSKIVPILTLAASAFVSACSDSSGPGSLDPASAVQSLAIAFQNGDGAQGTQATPDIATALSAIAPLLTRTTVVVNGVSQPMFAIGVRQSFPAGTCEENLYVDPAFPPPPRVCTPPSLGTALVFWQSHSAKEPPDRFLFLVTDPGTINFDFTNSTGDIIPTLGAYIEGQDKIWISNSGSITSNVASLNQPCNLTLPPYAKAATCSFATFDEQAQMVFESFDFNVNGSTSQATITIPRQTVPGVWVSISETQPVTVHTVANRVGGGLEARLARIAPGLLQKR